MFKGLKKKFSNKPSKAKDSGGGDKDAKGESKDDKAKPNSLSSENKPTNKDAPSDPPAEDNEKPTVEEPPWDPFEQPLPKFSETPRADQEKLLIDKLRLCQVTFHWPEDIHPSDATNKRIKREQLLELVEIIGEKQKSFPDAVLEQLINMVGANLFRALPSREGRQVEMEDEDSFPMEPSWPHLQIVYEFFLRFIVSSNLEVKGLKKYINSKFVLQILLLFDSEDRRERDYLKTILHRIYAKFMPLRVLIRKAINFTFWQFIDENTRHNGIAELLEILGSIINGFALPLKAEHKRFLFKVLVPMHRISSVGMFHTQLSYCVTQFVDKDKQLAVAVIKGLLRLWPRTDSGKEIILLQELEELLELTPSASYPELLDVLCYRLCRCVESSHFQVAERTLFLWQNEYIYLQFLQQYRAQVLPRFYPVLFANQTHWNPMVSKLTNSVLGMFMAVDADLVEQCSKNYELQVAEAAEKQKLRTKSWWHLENLAVLSQGHAAAVQLEEEERE